MRSSKKIIMLGSGQWLKGGVGGGSFVIRVYECEDL